MTLAEVTITPQAYELDPMNVVWHGHYMRYLDQARSGLFEAVNRTDPCTAEAGLSWPVFDVWLKYVRPIRPSQQFGAVARLKETGDRIRVDYLISDPETGKVVTRARTVQAACVASGEEMMEEGRRKTGTSAILSAEVPLRPQFCDAGPMERVWHPSYARYFEEARYALLDKLCYNHAEMVGSGCLWPIVEWRMICFRHLRLAQPIRVRASIVECGARMLVEYLVFDEASGALCTKAHTVQVAVSLATGELYYRAPDGLKMRLEKLGHKSLDDIIGVPSVMFP